MIPSSLSPPWQPDELTYLPEITTARRSYTTSWDTTTCIAALLLSWSALAPADTSALPWTG
jgi:hypothetical protein